MAQRRPGARDCARKVLDRTRRGAFATLALQAELDRSGLDLRDRSFATELSYGVLRWCLRLDWSLAAKSQKGIDRLDEMTKDAMRIAAYELLRLGTPPHAAVSECVSAVRRLRGARLAGLANAILRRLATEGEAPLPPAADAERRLSIETSAPPWLIRRAAESLTGEELPRFLAALNEPAPLWLRTNLLRTTPERLAERLAGLGAKLSRSAIVAEALRVEEGGGEVLRSPAFTDGECTVQDLAAQLVGRMVAPRAGERLLDACAGVGGKATHLAELSADGAEIDAVDQSPRKLELLRDHCRRLGIRGVRAMEGDVKALGASTSPGSYDAVLLDAPCSGLGVLRRHPEAKWREQTNELGPIVAEQRRLLEAVAPLVRPGGRLVYAVCSFAESEGSSQIARFVDAHPEFEIEGGALRTWPHDPEVQADAFYAARLVRRVVS